MEEIRSTVIGFVGTGDIAKAIVTGLARHSAEQFEIWLSPRNAEISAELAQRYPNVHIAKDNQDVLNRAHCVFMALRPQVAHEVLPTLALNDDHLVVNLIAGYDRERLEREVAGRPGRVIRAVPLLTVANGRCKTLIYPDEQLTREIFEPLGGTVAVSNEADFNTMLAMGASMGLFFKLLHTHAQWAAARGIDYASARAYLISQYAGLTEIADESSEPFDLLSKRFSTKGGLNEQVTTIVEDGGGFDLICEAFNRVEQRLLQ